MLRSIVTVIICALALVSASGLSQAAPAAPLPASLLKDATAGDINQVYWCGWRCRHRHYGYHRGWYHHRCWWRHGYRHCW
jgi:hypothetical protein